MTKIFDGAAEEDPIIITGLGRDQNGRGGTGGVTEKRRRQRDDDDDDDFNDGKRRMKFACDVAAYDINGHLWRVVSKEDAKVFYLTKGGEGGLVRVMTLERAGRFIRRAFPSSPKGLPLVHFFDELHEEWESRQDQAKRGIMPQGFGAMWPIFRGMLAGNHAADDNGALECLMFAKYSATQLVKVPFLLCAPKGTAIPFHLQRANWVPANSVVSNLPPRSAGGRQFISVSIENFAMFLPAFWDEAFEDVFDSILKALSGKGDPQAAKKVRETADICLLLLFHMALASWATAIWTQSRDEEILPDEAAERLKAAVDAVIDDLLTNKVEPYPHLNFLGPDGRLQRLVDATNAEELRLEVAAGESSGGGGVSNKQPMYRQPSNTTAASVALAGPGAAAAGAFASPPPPQQALVTPTAPERAGTGSDKKGLCLPCVLRLMNIGSDRACLAEGRWSHPATTRDASLERIERAVRFLPRASKARGEAELWLTKHKLTAGH